MEGGERIADCGGWRVSWGGKPQGPERRTGPEESFSGGPARLKSGKLWFDPYVPTSPCAPKGRRRGAGNASSASARTPALSPKLTDFVSPLRTPFHRHTAMGWRKRGSRMHTVGPGVKTL
jgi:hypothetical protein